MNVPPFSYSTLKAFETCARQYHEIKVLKKYPSPKTEQILYGERLHEAAEHYVASGVALTTEFEFMKPMLDNLLSLPGAKFAERKTAVTRDLVPCDWKAPDVWYKGIADFSAVDLEGKRGFVCDYKSGSNRFPDTDQLELMSLLLFAHHPEIEVVRSALLFVAKGTMERKTVRRAQAQFLWDRYRERNQLRECAHANGVFNPKQSGLCRKWCPVTTCEYNGAGG
jgi:hypothetical protein